MTRTWAPGTRETFIIRSQSDGSKHCGYCDGYLWLGTCADPECEGHEDEPSKEACDV